MRYRIRGGIIIRSENAAKPNSQISKYLQTKIAQLPTVNWSFDYGCGKLRYADVLLKTTNNLYVVDSEPQLSRTQKILGKRNSIRAYVQTLNSMTAQNVLEFEKSAQKFDRGFCINVLSVIPIVAIRTRVIETIKSKLRVGGTCLFAVQYRNSDFSRMKDMPNAYNWIDGFIVDSLRGYSFYGLIRPENLASMIVIPTCIDQNS